MTDENNKKTYQYLYADLMRQMEDRELLPGTALPSENALAAAYGISRQTVRRALEMMERDNAIVRRPGIGSFVNDRSNVSPVGERRKLVIGTNIVSIEASFYYGVIFSGLNQACEKYGCQLTLINKNDFDPGCMQLDALVLASPMVDTLDYYADLAASGLPVAVINRFPTRPEFAYFSVDYRRESIKAVDYLLMAGHRRIAVLGAEDGETVPGQRSQGWRMAFQRRGLEAPLDLSFPFSQMCGEGNGKLAEFLKVNQVSAVFVTLGSLLPVVAQAVARAGLRIPDDLEVMCFDDMEETLRLLGLQISYVKMPLLEMSRQAVDYLVRRRQNPQTPVERRLFDASLVINSNFDALEKPLVD